MAGDVFERPKVFLVEQGLFMPVCIELSPFFQVTFSSSLLLTTGPWACISTGSKSQWFIVVLLPALGEWWGWQSWRFGRSLAAISEEWRQELICHHSFRCDSSRSVKLPIATLPSFDDSCYKGLLVGWLASKHYTFKAYGFMQTQREFKTGICPFGKIGKHNAAWTHLNSNLSISLNISQCSKVSKVFKSQFTLHQVVHSVVSPSRCAWRLCKTRSILSHDMPWFLKFFDMPDMLKMSNDCDLPRNRGGLISMLAKFCVTFNM